MSSWDKVNGKKDKKSPEEKDKETGDWIKTQQKTEVSPINLVVYGLDGTTKSGICMDIREANEMDKKVFVIDIDGSATPIKEAYWGNDENVIVVDPIEITEGGDIDWISSYNRILDVCKWLRKHETELNLKGVVLDGLDTLLKICEYKMKVEDLKVNPQARVTDLWSWQFRNSAFLLVVKLIKGLKCDSLYTTHLKELKGWVTEAGKGKTLAVTGHIPEWEKSTPGLMFQKLSAERVEKGKVVEWKVKVDKCKTNSMLEGKVYEVLRVDHAKDEVIWKGIKTFLKECRHKR